MTEATWTDTTTMAKENGATMIDDHEVVLEIHSTDTRS